MDTKEITTQIVMKMLETNVFTFETCSGNFESEKIMENNRKRIETICEAYKTVYQTVSNRSK